MFPPLIRPSFSQIRGRGWNNIVLTNWLHFPGTCSQNSPKQRSLQTLQKFRESFDIDFWLQVLLVVPLHQRMDLGGLGDQDHGSFGADVWWIRKGLFFTLKTLAQKNMLPLTMISGEMALLISKREKLVHLMAIPLAFFGHFSKAK